MTIYVLSNGQSITTATGNDTVILGEGNHDSVTATGSNDTITLGNGNDTVTAGDGSTITLGNGNDTVTAVGNLGTAITTIDFPGSTFTNVTGINDAGEIFGYYLDADGQLHSFVDSGGTLTTIDPRRCPALC